MVSRLMVSDRPKWNNRVQFFLYTSAVLFSPFSVWKFPIFWFKSGGVALFVPLVVCMLTMGAPLVCLEISLGQFMQKGGPNAWGVVPLVKGISVTSMLLIVMKVSTNLILASWSAYYLYLSLTNQVPRCATDSASLRPFSQVLHIANKSSPNAAVSRHLNKTMSKTFVDRTPLSFELSQDMNVTCQDLYSKFWSNNILDMSESITSPGSSVIEIFISTVVVSLVCYTLVVRDIRWSGKIMYILAPLPLVGFLSIIAWTASSGCNLGLGIYSLLTPCFEVLTHPEPWFACARATLHILATGLNVFPSLASYNNLVNYTVRDSWVICLLSVTVNVLASLAIFGLLGQVVGNIDMENDPFLIFMVVSEVYMKFQNHEVLCSLFVIFIIIIIMSTTAVYIESLVSSIVDLSFELRRWRLPIVTGTMSVGFLLTIPMSTQGGVYVYKVFERLTDGGFLILVISIIECLVIGFMYGGTRFYDNLEMMTGKRPQWWLKFCWAWLSPSILLATLVYHEYSAPLYILDLGVDDRHYDFAKVLLMSMVTLLLLPIIAVAVWVVYSKNGTCIKRIGAALRPDLKPHQVPIRWRLEGHWIKFTDRL